MFQGWFLWQSRITTNPDLRNSAIPSREQKTRGPIMNLSFLNSSNRWRKCWRILHIPSSRKFSSTSCWMAQQCVSVWWGIAGIQILWNQIFHFCRWAKGLNCRLEQPSPLFRRRWTRQLSKNKSDLILFVCIVAIIIFDVWEWCSVVFHINLIEIFVDNFTVKCVLIWFLMLFVKKIVASVRSNVMCWPNV